MTDNFEETIRALTQPIDGQLPRPWMTAMKNPLEAKVFIVGKNQRNRYPPEEISHERHIDGLFNRNGESCRGLYDVVTKGKPSPTRRNTDRLVERLKQHGVGDILETNVVCFSTPMSADLRVRANVVGARKGEEIFRYLLSEIAPPVLIVHGAGTVRQVSAILRADQLRVPGSADENCDVQMEHHLVIPIPSLAPPEANKWASWRDGYLEDVAIRVRDKLAP